MVLVPIQVQVQIRQLQMDKDPEIDTEFASGIPKFQKRGHFG